MHAPRQELSRHWRLIVFTVALVLFFYLIFVLRDMIFPFVLGIIIVSVLLPIITWVEDRLPKSGRWLIYRRTVLIIVLYLVLLAIFALVTLYVIIAVTNSLGVLASNAQNFASDATERLRDWTSSVRRQLPPDVQQQADNILQDAVGSLTNAMKAVLSRSIALVPTTVQFVIGLAAVPFFVFYMLNDWSKLRKGFYSSMPLWAAKYSRGVMRILSDVIGRYVRAQIILALVVAALDFVGLMILRMPFAPVLAVFAGLTEVMPIIGPWIGGITAVVVSLALAPDKVLWVALLFLLVQVLENNLLVPKIQGDILRLHPVIIIVLMVVAGGLLGLWGLILVVPVTVTVIELSRFLYRTAAAEHRAHEDQTVEQA